MNILSTDTVRSEAKEILASLEAKGVSLHDADKILSFAKSSLNTVLDEISRGVNKLQSNAILSPDYMRHI